jgi:hypothetical protein
MRGSDFFRLFATVLTLAWPAGTAGAQQCDLSLPCGSSLSSNSTAFSITNAGGNAIQGHAEGSIGVFGRSNNRAIVGTQGETSCAGTYAVGGCATTGDGVFGRANEGMGVFGRSNNGIGVFGRGNNRAIVGTQGETSCAGTYAVGGCATTGDGVLGRSKDGFAGRFDGKVLVKSLQITGGSDLAELFSAEQSEIVKPGTLVSIDPEQPGQLRVSTRAYDRAVAGIVSGANGLTPGVRLEQARAVMPGSLLVALTGRVYALADDSGGAIAPGDLLTTSDIPGHAMKVTDYRKAQGAIVGKAMTQLREGRGLVLVLVSLQ